MKNNRAQLKTKRYLQPRFKINSAMIITFVFVERNTVTIAVKLKKMCVNVDKGRGYVVLYRLKMRHIYCKYEDDI